MALHFHAASTPPGVFDDAFGNVPEGSVPVSAEEWRAALDAHCATGRPLVAGPDGKPVLGEHPSLTVEQALRRLAAQAAMHEIGGVTYTTADGVATRFSMVVEVICQVSALARRGVGGLIRTPDGTFVRLGIKDVHGLDERIGWFQQACAERHASLQEAVRADPSADISQGWPV